MIARYILSIVTQLKCMPALQRRSLWGIAWMCFFWSMATLMAFSYLPFFLTEELGASKTALGTIEGVSIFMAFAAKVLTGILSDYLKLRRPLIIIGNIFSALIKPILAISGSIYWVFAAKSIDRFSKGVRSAPTDALISDLSLNENRGLSYGIRQTLYTSGAIVGAVVAYSLYRLFHDYRLIFWCSTIPALCAVLISWHYVKEPTTLKLKTNKFSISDIANLPHIFWWLLGVSFLLMMARFSESFLSLRAQELGWNKSNIPLLLGGYEIAHALIALPMGRLADMCSRTSLLVRGILVLTLADIVLFSLSNSTTACIGILLCGAHMGMTQGLLSTLISEHTLPHLRGTAFSLYYLIVGISVLLGNHLAGYLADIGKTTQWTFLNGAMWTILSVLLLLYVQKRYENHSKLI